MSNTERLRQIPSVDRLLQTPMLQEAVLAFGRTPVVATIRETLDTIRAEILAGAAFDLSPAALAPRIIERLHERLLPSLRPVLNATGVIIHTNLGRAPLSHAALEAIRAIGEGYSTLEYDLAAGKRGSRYTHVGDLLAELTGAEAGLVANNNAAALVLILATHAAGRDVLISRAHLVEIGGGFRIPDIMTQSGASLREVGTTNRTYARDYEAAITPEQTAMILRVHTSNFRIEGFVHQPTLKELVALARRYGLLVGDDLGSGALLDTTTFGLAPEPRPQESIADGADVVCFSGDKLLGGPQAGCIVGRRDVIEAIKRHPLMRAFRVDKTTLAALDATLRAYQRGTAVDELPIWRMIATPPETLRQRAEAWVGAWRRQGIRADVVESRSAIGGGSLPGQTLPTWVVRLPSSHPQQDAARLRQTTPPVIARIEDGCLLLDPRTIRPEEDALLVRVVGDALCR